MLRIAQAISPRYLMTRRGSLIDPTEEAWVSEGGLFTVHRALIMVATNRPRPEGKKWTIDQGELENRLLRGTGIEGSDLDHVPISILGPSCPRAFVARN